MSDRLVCADEEDEWPSYLYLPIDKEGTGGYYDRQGRVRCKRTWIQRDEEFTLFSFNQPRWSAEVDPFPQARRANR